MCWLSPILGPQPSLADTHHSPFTSSCRPSTASPGHQEQHKEPQHWISAPWAPRDTSLPRQTQTPTFTLTPSQPCPGASLGVPLPGRLLCLESCLESWPRTTGPRRKGEGVGMVSYYTMMTFWWPPFTQAHPWGRYTGKGRAPITWKMFSKVVQ